MLSDILSCTLYQTQGLDVRHTPHSAKWSGMALLFHGQEVSWRLQLPASCIPSLSRKLGWVKVALGCSLVLLGIFKASKAQVLFLVSRNHRRL